MHAHQSHPDQPATPVPARRRVFSGIKPTGRPTLGNHLGALRRFVALQDELASPADALFCVVDLHAMTVPHDPAELRARTLDVATLYLAAGLDPDRSTVFVQSMVPAHRELAYLLECTARTGELARMIQYKEKGRGEDSTRVSLYTYPVLMAADILVYDTTEVPVGDDQRQHVELTRDLALRFNREYGDTFVVPEAVTPPVAARVMDLLDPTTKMGKSASSTAGSILLLDPPDVVRRKVARAVTDSQPTVELDPDRRPGVANLLSILAACTGADAAELAPQYSSYGALKRDVADAVVAELEPLQRRHAELTQDPACVLEVLHEGAQRATEIAAPVLRRASDAIGLLTA